MTDGLREAIERALRELGYIDVERSSPDEWWQDIAKVAAKAAREFLASPSSRAATDEEIALAHFSDAVDRVAELDGFASSSVEFWYAYIAESRERLRAASPLPAEPSEAEIEAAACAVLDGLFDTTKLTGAEMPRTRTFCLTVAKSALLAARAVMTDPQPQEDA